MRSPLGWWGSGIGFVVILAAVLKTWWDSRVNLTTGMIYLVALTICYFAIRAARTSSERDKDLHGPGPI